ncbi:MAG: flagellar hook-basal body complex protein FliE [Anaerovoracaceae bacterium]|jgi:flagellar hook-basal body complex protein FliE
MFIVPMSSIINVSELKSLDSGKAALKTDGETSSGFKEIFENMVNNVEETEAATKMDAYKLSIGEMDDMHTMMINAFKADAALQTMVQLRNKFLEAYSEIMRINI